MPKMEGLVDQLDLQGQQYPADQSDQAVHWNQLVRLVE
jgi:hypothetical protein